MLGTLWVISCSETVQTGSGQKTAKSSHSPQECVEESHKTTTRQAKYDCYHRHGKGIPWTIHSKNIYGTDKMFVKHPLYTRKREEQEPSEYGNNVTWFCTIRFSIELT